MRNALLMLRLATRDWWHERLLSLCAVLALASMLTPLLVLHGVRVGLVESLRNNLLQDPTALIIIPVGSSGSGYTEAQMAALRARPDVLFVIARTRDVAAEMQFVSKSGAFVPLTLEPTAEGDPLLQRHRQPVPTSGGAGKQATQTTAVISASAARKLGVSVGDSVEGRLGRTRPDGIMERQSFAMTVTGVLPAEATAYDTAFLPLSVLEDVQDYRDYVAVPQRGFAGDARSNDVRRYESFRLYARDLDSVPVLDKLLEKQGINVLTKAKSIADIKRIDSAITQLLAVIALAVGSGFIAFTLSSALAAVRRKDKMLGMLRLLGFSRGALLLYPLGQTLLTGACGVLVAWGFALGVAHGIDVLFAAQMTGTNAGAICVILPEHMLLTLAAVLGLSTLAALYPAFRAAGVDPALVVRDV